MKHLLSGDDSGLLNTWDEICAQVQGDQSVFWDAYEDTVDSVILNELQKLPDLELQALWLQTDVGLAWRDNARGEIDTVVDRPVDGGAPDCEEGRDNESAGTPTSLDDIIPHVSERVYSLAAEWSNRRIRSYLRDDEDC